MYYESVKKKKNVSVPFININLSHCYQLLALPEKKNYVILLIQYCFIILFLFQTKVEVDYLKL